MSSLIFHTEKDLAIIATDTLVVSADDGEPYLFSSKTHFIPHSNTIVAGTGVANFCNEWFLNIINDIVANDVMELDSKTPEALAKLWQRNKNFFDFSDTITTTIYHFGFSRNEDCIKSFAYRSTNNFQSELLTYGLRFKPECDILENLKLPNDIKKMMESQRVIQSLKPKESRIYIGGEIHLSVLNKDGCYIRTVDRFDDYDSDKTKIYSDANLKKLLANHSLKLTENTARDLAARRKIF